MFAAGDEGSVLFGVFLSNEMKPGCYFLVIQITLQPKVGFNMQLFKRVTQILCFTIASVFSLSSFAGDEIYTGFFNDNAVKGYDTVAFFTEGKPVKGSKKIKAEYKGVNWLFSSEENKKLFEENPEKYAPQYGGHCAWAVGENSARAPGDPKYWRIVDDKLYLNYNKSVQKKWLADIPGFIEKADANWPKLLEE